MPETWRYEQTEVTVGNRLKADVCLVLSNNADIWIKLTNLVWSEKSLSGRVLLRSDHSALRAFRSGFGLATASVNSAYQFGGVADLLILEPTAGREAVTVDGLQLLQSMMTEIDLFTSKTLSSRDESDASTAFMNWVVAHSRYEMCGHLRMSVSPGDRIALSEVAKRSEIRPMMFYGGNDQSIIKMHASDETPLLVLARTNPRRRCELKYLEEHTMATVISDSPAVTNRRSRNEFSMAESALAYRMENTLDRDYFLKAEVDFGNISHGLPVLADKQPKNVRVTLNPDDQTVKLILGLYDMDFMAFGSIVTDFVRTAVFPRISDYVPSNTRQGAEAFLKAIRRPRELFEYATDDLGNLPKIWQDYNEGLLTIEQAVERSKSAVRSSVQIVDSQAAASAREVVPDVVQNEEVLKHSSLETAQEFDPSPAITRLETPTSAKILVIDESEAALRGYRCFLAITDKVRTEMGEFFLQPHRTSIVWGGQKTLFIFLHHSGQFGLYYDLQMREPIDAQSGGGPYPTTTIVLKDRIFIPIPDLIRASFIPKKGERKRFEVRADILRTEDVERP